MAENSAKSRTRRCAGCRALQQRQTISASLPRVREGGALTSEKSRLGSDVGLAANLKTTRRRAGLWRISFPAAWCPVYMEHLASFVCIYNEIDDLS